MYTEDFLLGEDMANHVNHHIMQMETNENNTTGKYYECLCDTAKEKKNRKIQSKIVTIKPGLSYSPLES